MCWFRWMWTASVINDAAAFAADGAEETASAMKWVYVARPEYQANVEVLATLPAPVKKWKSFVAGMGAMLAISVAAAGSWQYVNRPNPLQAQLAASLAPLPERSRQNRWIYCVSRLLCRRT